MDMSRKLRLQELAKSSLFTQAKSELSKSEKIELSYQRFRAMMKAAGLTRDEILEGIPVVELFDTDIVSCDTSLALLLITHFTIGLGTILERSAGRSDLDDIIDQLMDLDALCPALATELGYGNNVQSMETEARFDPETQEFIIHTPNDRALKFIGYTAQPGVPKISVLWARLWEGDTDRGVHTFIVPVRGADGQPCPGVTITAAVDRMTPDPLDHAITRFDHVRIPRRMFLGGPHCEIGPDGSYRTDLPSNRATFLDSARRFEYAKLCLVTATLRMARVSIALALEFAAQREIVTASGFRFPVGQLPTQQQPLMLAYAKFRAADALCRAAMRAKSESRGELAGEIISIAKYACIPLTLEAIQTCTERCGSHAFMERNLLSTYLILTMHGNTADGDAMPMALQVARNMLRTGDYQPPATQQLPTAERPKLVLALMERRESAMFGELSARTGPDLAPEAWLACLNSAYELARTRGQRMALGFLEAEDPDIAEIFGLLLLLEHAAWFASRDLVDRAQFADLDERLERLSLRLFASERDIRASLDVDEVVARTPMGHKDYVAAWASLCDADDEDGQDQMAG